jgi:hypothetical protein
VEAVAVTKVGACPLKRAGLAVTKAACTPSLEDFQKFAVARVVLLAAVEEPVLLPVRGIVNSFERVADQPEQVGHIFGADDAVQSTEFGLFFSHSVELHSFLEESCPEFICVLNDMIPRLWSFVSGGPVIAGPKRCFEGHV